VITAAVAVAPEVMPASIWLLSPDRQQLRCASLFEHTSGRHSEAVTLTAAAYPRHFAALEADRAAGAGHARNNPRTSFTHGYLAPLGITFMLDSPIRFTRRLVGTVCREHVGPP